MNPMVIPSVIAIIFVIGMLGFWRVSVVSDRKFTKDRDEREKARVESDQKYFLRRRVYEEFTVDVNTISQRDTQDEIVRCVNLLAGQASRDCASHSRSSNRKDDSASDAAYSKRRWLEARNIAIEVCPELEARMPHFGEFEPLTSYNVEHLIQTPK